MLQDIGRHSMACHGNGECSMVWRVWHAMVRERVTCYAKAWYGRVSHLKPWYGIV